MKKRINKEICADTYLEKPKLSTDWIREDTIISAYTDSFHLDVRT